MTAPISSTAFDTAFESGLATPPEHDARALTANGKSARITLNGMVYTLTITRAGKLILTK